MSEFGPINRRTILAYPLAVALCGRPALAQGTQITLRIGARPPAPAAVAGWSAALTGAADAAITAAPRPLAAGQTVGTWIGANFSKHHIIPQSLLQVAAKLALEEKAGPDATRQRLREALAAIAAGDAFAADGSVNLGPVAWSQVNLFEGPGGFYRGDDPGEGPEQVRPRSFDQARWQALQNVSTAINGLGTVKDRPSNDGKDYVILLKNLAPQQKGGKTGLEKIVDAFQGLAKIGGGQAHANVSPFNAADWVGANNADIQVAQLIAYNNDRIQAQLNTSKKNAYKLRSGR